MSHTYKELFLAFQEILGHKHGATFNDGDIETLHVDGKPADKAVIESIKLRADEIARNES